MAREAVALAGVEWEPCLLEPRRDPEITRLVRQRLGFVPPHVHYYSACPWLVRLIIHFDYSTVPFKHLDERLVELIALVVAQDNSCRFCYAATRVMLRLQGVPDDAIRRLEQDAPISELPAGARAAVDFARRLSRASPLPDPGALAPLRAAGFDADAIREIVFITALNVASNRVTTLAAVPTAEIEGIPDRLAFRLLRPALRLIVGVQGRWARAKPLPPPVRGGPFEPLVAAFDGLPLAAIISQHLEEAWRSDLLPRRTKGFIAGVIARALGCEASERIARVLLSGEGVPEGDVDTVLSTLAAPCLTAAEEVVVPFARETVRYAPARIQRQGRTVRGAIGQAAFVELIGFAALTNAAARMAAVLCPR